MCDDPYLDLLVLPVRSRPSSGQVTPAAIIHIHGDDRSNADRRDALMQLFGLSRTEAGLTLSLVRGRTLNQAALENKLTVETGRNYSKRIFAKTGTSHQGDLIRLVLTSVVALA